MRILERLSSACGDPSKVPNKAVAAAALAQIQPLSLFLGQPGYFRNLMHYKFHGS
jgi:hypothetical protein